MTLTGVADGLHLVHVIVVNDVVKGCVELVEEVHHLVRRAAAGQLSEANDVAVVQPGQHQRNAKRKQSMETGSHGSSDKLDPPGLNWTRNYTDREDLWV